MRIMLDTNILISAIVFDGKIEKLLNFLKDKKNQLLVSDYVENEFRKNLNKKWSARADYYFGIYETLPIIRCRSTTKILGKVRDKKDIPVLSDVIFHKVDILLTGDKDFLESEIKNPLIISPTLLFEYMQKKFKKF